MHGHLQWCQQFQWLSIYYKQYILKLERKVSYGLYIFLYYKLFDISCFHINNIKSNLFFFKKENKIIKFLLFSFNNYSNFNFVFLLKVMIYLLMILLSFFNYLFLSTSLVDCFYIYCHLSLKISKLLSHIAVLVSSSVGLFFMLKFYDKNYSKEDKFSKFSIIISMISLSLLFIFYYQNLIDIASDYILTHLID